ncbi:MAG TPA: response regulator [Verrucomicrobiae bacterium]|nr:response regulator [Verrucomicrobiae bacterium]
MAHEALSQDTEEKTNILMVDDSPANLLALEALLSCPEYNLLRAESGKEALTLLQQHDCALILLDVQMPGMDGFECAQLIKQGHRTKDIPIIFITAIGKDISFVFRGYKYGAVDYILKPLDPYILKCKISVFVELYKKSRKIEKQAISISEKTSELLLSNQALQLEMKERMKAQKEVLEISDRERKRLGQDLHDGLSQQLAAIGFMVKAIQKKISPEFGKEIKRLEEIIGFVKKTINDTNSLSRGLNPISLEAKGLPCALEELAKNTTELCGTSCGFSNDGVVNFKNYYLEINLYRIAQEAIHNALKHGKATRIEIKLQAKGEKNCMIIEDNGVGFQAKTTESLGMGLRNMKYRAQMIDAEMQVSPRSEGGTLVQCIFYPNISVVHDIGDGPGEEEPTGKVTVEKIADRKRILLVDDHPLLRKGVAELIEQEPDMGVCGEAEDASQALELIEKTKPNVILVDISLKESSGIDLVKKINQRYDGLFIMVLSMHEENMYAESALAAGAKGYVTKQDSAETLVKAIRQVLSGQYYVGGRHRDAISKKFGFPLPALAPAAAS